MIQADQNSTQPQNKRFKSAKETRWTDTRSGTTKSDGRGDAKGDGDRGKEENAVKRERVGKVVVL